MSLLYFTFCLISELPVFLVRPKNQVFRTNQARVRFDCVAKGNPSPHISWYFKGDRILLDERISLHHNGSIFIENVKNNDAGEYTCQAENVNGKINASAELEIKGKLLPR